MNYQILHLNVWFSVYLFFIETTNCSLEIAINAQVNFALFQRSSALPENCARRWMRISACTTANVPTRPWTMPRLTRCFMPALPTPARRESRLRDESAEYGLLRLTPDALPRVKGFPEKFVSRGQILVVSLIRC